MSSGELWSGLHGLDALEKTSACLSVILGKGWVTVWGERTVMVEAGRKCVREAVSRSAWNE